MTLKKINFRKYLKRNLINKILNIILLFNSIQNSEIIDEKFSKILFNRDFGLINLIDCYKHIYKEKLYLIKYI